MTDDSPFPEQYRDETILVTGGGGAIGGNLVGTLASVGARKVVILDDLSSSHNWNIHKGKNVQFVKGSILNDSILDSVFEQDIRYVFHLAAHFANQNSVENPETDLMVNGMGILKVLQRAKLKKVERFVYSSSGCGVYGKESKLPFEEKDISISLNTPYQVTKLLGELYCNYFYNLYGVPIVNARFFNVYGPGEVPGRFRNVIPNFFFWAMNGLALPITGSGQETRDWTYVTDIVNGLLAMGMVDKAVGEAFNLGSGREHRVVDMANMVNEITENREGVVFTERRDWDVKSRLLSSIDKARDILGYEPRMDFREGLEEVHHWFKDNWDNIRGSARF